MSAGSCGGIFRDERVPILVMSIPEHAHPGRWSTLIVGLAEARSGFAIVEEQNLWRERKEEVRALIPLNLDGHMFTDDWQSGKRTQIRQRMAADFIGWENDNDKFEAQFEAVVKALRADSGGREQAPEPKL